jgi:hypothetical protein
VQADRTSILNRALQAICRGDITAARETLRVEYPFVAVTSRGRRYTENESLRGKCNHLGVIRFTLR